jgi:hypothetical protein
MKQFLMLIIFSLVILTFNKTYAQIEESPIKIFGYFQNSFQYWTTFEDRREQDSFSLQQLNFFLQKDLGRNWTALINFEFLNNFSSSHQWGAANLEEAWLRYRLNEKFSIKLGLQIPIFNNLNEINNRTPLLPYIIRPLVYETSFGEFYPVEEFVPARAFVQIYGFLPLGQLKLDYAVFAGNSPNVSNGAIGSEASRNEQTGIDTTTTFLVGGRVGVRYGELKLGISGTHEKRNDLMYIAEDIGRQPSELKEIPAIRFGGDLSYGFGDFWFESEFIRVDVNSGIPELDLGLEFYYATLGYYWTEKLFIYGSYWITQSKINILFTNENYEEEEEILVPNFGVAYNLTDRIRMKAQYARVRSDDMIKEGLPRMTTKDEDNFSVYAVAISVFF